MICSLSPSDQNLQDTGFDNGRLLVILDLTAAAASGLKSLDDHQRLLVSNLTEDDVLAIEPAGYHSGNEELRAVAIGTSCQLCFRTMFVLAYVLGPALAIERSPGLVCLREKFSSANFSP
jgi:hypothetical protein